MRAHLGGIVLAVVLALGVVLEFVGSNLVGTVLILGAVWMGIGLARGRNPYWQRQGRFSSTRSRAEIDAQRDREPY